MLANRPRVATGDSHKPSASALGLCVSLRENMQTKRCTKCGIIKPLDDFYKQVGGKYGYGTWCKPCKSLQGRTGSCCDCGKAIHYSSTRCLSCANRVKMKNAWARGAFDTEQARKNRQIATKTAWDNPARLEDWSKRMKARWQRGDFEGHSEAMKASWARGDFNGSLEDKESRRKISESKKKAWAEGVYDGVFKSPSKPELAIAEALDNLGIDYETQYRLEGDGRPFDFYLPPATLIEVDGIYWHSLPGRPEQDAAKTALAEERGYRLVRVTDVEIRERGVVAIIDSIGD